MPVPIEVLAQQVLQLPAPERARLLDQVSAALMPTASVMLAGITWRQGATRRLMQTPLCLSLALKPSPAFEPASDDLQPPSRGRD